jgi:hypothetical protein
MHGDGLQKRNTGPGLSFGLAVPPTGLLGTLNSLAAACILRTGGTHAAIDGVPTQGSVEKPSKRPQHKHTSV